MGYDFSLAADSILYKRLMELWLDGKKHSEEYIAIDKELSRRAELRLENLKKNKNAPTWT